jgi:hypothetical protein
MPIPKIVVTVALMAAQTALQMTQKVRGPRLDDLKTTTAEYGTPIPRFWGKRKFNCPVIWAADLIETRHTSKGKAGKNTQYKYFADFAILICDHEIDAVTRIWMDEKLVYQTTDVGPTSVGAAAGLTVGGNMRVYLGTETQDADPLMEAWCDDKYGANSCPAYRGSSYIVFERLPVNNFGNRIPNITVEAVSSKAPAYPHEQLTGGVTLSGACYGRKSDGAIDFTRLYLAGGSHFQIWDVPSRTLLVDISTSVGTSHLGTNSDGSFYGQNSSKTALISEGGAAVIVGGSMSSGAWVTNAGTFGITGATSGSIVAPDGGTGSIITTTGFHPAWYFDDLDGTSWAIGGQRTGSSYTTGFGFYNLMTATEYLISAATSGAAYAFDNGADQFFVWQDDTIYLVDKATMTIVDGPVSTNSYNGSNQAPFVGVDQGAKTIWIGFTQYSTQDLSELETFSSSSWATGTSDDSPIYDPINDAIWTKGTLDSGITIRYLNRVSPLGVTLQTIVDSVSDWVDLTEKDTSALTQPILGYSVTQGTGKDMIGPLLDIHDVDARPHDFEVQFLNRGSAPSGTLLTEDFVRADNRYTVTIKQDTDLPRKLTFNFADNDHEQQPNNAIAQRPFDAVDSTREETVDLSTYADTADGAQQKADRYLRRIWNSREGIKNSLTPQVLAIEPGDVKTLSLDGVLRNARLDKLTYTQTGIECEWIRDEVSVAAVNTATTGAAMDNSDPQTITIPSPVKGFILDAPLIQDADNDVNPVLYEAAGSYNTGTDTGATVNRGDDGTYDELFGSIDATNLATWGYATSALATANPNLWDRGNSVDVQIFGTLTSATEAEIDADPTLNLMAIGVDGRWEYVQPATATLTGTSGTANLYTLSVFKRGRRGTEGNVGNHEVGDQILLLNKAIPVEVGTDDIGDSMSFKIQSIGRDVDAAGAIDLTYDGNTLKPYAPASIKWIYDGTDLQGTIIRRTRVGGAWVGGSTIPLSENSEAYEVDVYNGATFKRTISVSGTNVFSYTAAMAAADGITLPTPPTINAYQISDTVGRGFALAA